MIDGMQLALQQAKIAATKNEVPIGCAILINDSIIALAHNQTITDSSPCSHAEIVAIQKACKQLSNHRLVDCNVYVTLEPCLMCVGAMIQARIKSLSYATKDSRVGVLSNEILKPYANSINHVLISRHD